MLRTILVAVPAFSRVEPAIISGPTAGAIVMQKTGLTYTKSIARLKKSDDLIREAIGEDIEPRLRALIRA